MKLIFNFLDFPVALMRLLKNKILMYNILSTIFYILGSSGYITFLSKYMEVQFNKNSADASIITGPITIIGKTMIQFLSVSLETILVSSSLTYYQINQQIMYNELIFFVTFFSGMVTGFILSGYVISKYKPGPRKLFLWNVIVGFGYMIGQFTYIFLSCDNSYLNDFTGTLNLTAQCNTNCSCTGVAYSPVCFEPTSTTFFSPCHAGCNRWDDKEKFYDNCACALDNQFTKPPLNYSTILQTTAIFMGPDKTSSPYSTEFTSSSVFSTILPVVSTTQELPVSIVSTDSTLAIPNATVEAQYEPILFKSIINTTENSTDDEQLNEENSTRDSYDVDLNGKNEEEEDDTTTTTTTTTTTSSSISTDDNSENDYTTTEENLSRQERSLGEETTNLLKMVPGACLAGCTKGFYLFTIISFIINWFGATGRIGNILLNFR